MQASATTQFFIARQPILDGDGELAAYELLFRANLRNAFDESDGDVATNRVIASASMVFGLDELVGCSRAFVNLTEGVLLDGTASLLPAEAVVLEVLESVEPTPEVIAACAALKDAGYTLALDDFVHEPRFAPLIELADIVKVDFLETSPEEQARLAKELLPLGIAMLAEKVEDYATFRRAKAMGYQLFQGYYFARPEVLQRTEIRGSKVSQLQLLQEVHAKDANIERIEAALLRDPTLSFRLLRYINSAFFAWQTEVRSLRHALVLMGEDEFRKWVTMVAMAGLASDKPSALLQLSVQRALFLSGLAPMVGQGERESEFFLLGLFSLLEAMVDRPLAEALSDIALSRDLRDALLHHTGPLAPGIVLCEHYERGDWDAVRHIAGFRVSEQELTALYRSSVEDTGRIFADDAKVLARSA